MATGCPRASRVGKLLGLSMLVQSAGQNQGDWHREHAERYQTRSDGRTAACWRRSNGQGRCRLHGFGMRFNQGDRRGGGSRLFRRNRRHVEHAGFDSLLNSLLYQFAPGMPNTCPVNPSTQTVFFGSFVPIRRVAHQPPTPIADRRRSGIS